MVAGGSSRPGQYLDSTEIYSDSDFPWTILIGTLPTSYYYSPKITFIQDRIIMFGEAIIA